jgi:hypothetical protein
MDSGPSQSREEQGVRPDGAADLTAKTSDADRRRKAPPAGVDVAINSAFLDAIERRMKARGLTQAALARKVGANKKFLTTWRGRLKNSPKGDRLDVKLGTVLNLLDNLGGRLLEYGLPPSTAAMIRQWRPEHAGPEDPGLRGSGVDGIARENGTSAASAPLPLSATGAEVETLVVSGLPPAAGERDTPEAIGAGPLKPALIWTFLVYGLLAGILPLGVLAAGHRDALSPDGLCRLYCRVYGHLFLFPATCGLLLVGLLFGPIAALILGRPDAPGPGRPPRARAAPWFALWLGASLLVVLTDFFAGNHALWEVAPALVAAQGQDLEDHFRHPDRDPTGRARQAFVRKIDAWIAGGPANWSWARWAYAIGLFLQVSTLIAIPFLTIVSLAQAPPTTEGNPATMAVARNLTLALFVASFWWMTRITFLVEKARLYPGYRIVILDWINGILFISSYIFATVLICQLPARERRPLLALLVLGAILVLGFVGIAASTDWPSRIFGRDCDEVNYLLLLFFLLMVIFSFKVRAIRSATIRGKPSAGR